MAFLITLALALCCLSAQSSTRNSNYVWAAPISDSPPAYETMYYENMVDHFDPGNTDTYMQKFLFSDDFFGKGQQDSTLKLPEGCAGPILVYTGNEGPIDAFWKVYSCMRMLCPRTFNRVVN